MLNILGSKTRLCNGQPSRRSVLQAGTLALGAGSLGLSELLQAQGKRSSGGKVKRILMLYLQGAASQHETWDPKPDAPEDVKGKWGATSTAVPGLQICDQLPRVAKIVYRLAIVRSMSHNNNNHSNVYTLTGRAAVNFASETNPHDDRHLPFFMSVLDYLEDQTGRPQSDMPTNMGLPWRFSTHGPFSRRAGPYGTFLGNGYDPVWTTFDGEATRSAGRVSFFNKLKSLTIKDPYLGITPESRLRVSENVRLRKGLTLDRFDKRRALAEQFDTEKSQLANSRGAVDLDRFQEMAYSMLTSERLRNALDVSKEPRSLRDRYGMHLFGQSALIARRLLEADVPLVSVFWDEYKVVNTAWDTHFNHFTRLGDELLPGFDAAVSSLILDLEDRGLLDDTLVLCLTEHGRTPRVKPKKQGGHGREHWSKVYSIMLAGAGIQTGSVVGASDAIGAFVKDRPVDPKDILATVYHLLDVSPTTAIPDRLGRPISINLGKVVRELVS